MVRWSDLGAGVLAAPRVLLRRDLWLEVLRRALFSRVFVGYALLAFLLFMGGRALYTSMNSGPGPQLGGLVTLVFAMVAGPLLLLLAGVLLLPYACWVFNPPAARLLQRYLDLPPPLEAEPAFFHHLAWTLPTLGAVLLFLGLDLVPVTHRWLSLALIVAAMALVLLAVMKLFARSALAAFYDRADTERFLAATRRQRLLVWLPVVLVIGLLLQTAVGVLQVPVFAWWSKSRAAGGGTVLLFVLALAVQALAVAFAAIAFAGALLLACGRVPAGGIGGPRTLGLHSETVPYTPPRRRGLQPAPAAPPQVPAKPRGRRLALAATAVVAVLAGGLFFTRLTLVDWYLSSERDYRTAPDALVTAPGFDLARREHRVVGGYVRAACKGDIDRMRWLRQVGAAQGPADEFALLCAACEGRSHAVEWLLAATPPRQLGRLVLPADGRRRTRSALTCAAALDDLPMVKTLLQRGAPPALPAGHEAVHLAASRLRWDMVAALLRADPRAAGSALFAALDAARAAGPQRPVELLPRMLGAGLSAGARDAEGRTVYHWAAMHHDLALARALLQRPQPADAGAYDADAQGAQAWMHVLRKAERDGRQLTPEAAELLRLLLPPQASANARVPFSAVPNALPEGWSARAIALNDPLAREALGEAFDLGQLPQDPATWWKFSSPQSAEALVRSATLTQLMRAENPEAPPGLEPRRLSAALAEAGLEPLALEVRLAVEGKRR